MQAARGLRGWRDDARLERSLALFRSPTRSRPAPDELIALEVENTGKPIALTRRRRSPPMVDQIRFFATRARNLEGKARRVHGRPHVVHPARAGRRVRPGRAVELPDDDGGLEVRPGDRRRQHRRAQAERHHAGDTTLLAEIAAEFLPPACST
jgi:hypothetical protein